MKNIKSTRLQAAIMCIFSRISCPQKKARAICGNKKYSMIHPHEFFNVLKIEFQSNVSCKNDTVGPIPCVAAMHTIAPMICGR